MRSCEHETLHSVLEQYRDVGGDEVLAALPTACPTLFTSDATVTAIPLKSRVIRLMRTTGDTRHSLILKCLKPLAAERNALVLRRWLPRLDLAHAAPALVATLGTRRGDYVWHVYQDLGSDTLDPRHAGAEALTTVVELIAALHVRAIDLPLLPECHQYLTDFGMHYFTTNVSGALAGVESLLTRASRFDASQQMVLRQLQERLRALARSIPRRAAAAADLAVPATLLHGDLWTTNTPMVPGVEGYTPYLIDWDHVGVGPVTYDLSTLLYRCPPPDRLDLLNVYRREIGRSGWTLPSASDCNLLFETAECARYANRVIWPAMALIGDGEDWGHAELAETLEWFDALTPALVDAHPERGASACDI